MGKKSNGSGGGSRGIDREEWYTKIIAIVKKTPGICWKDLQAQLKPGCSTKQLREDVKTLIERRTLVQRREGRCLRHYTPETMFSLTKQIPA